VSALFFGGNRGDFLGRQDGGLRQGFSRGKEGGPTGRIPAVQEGNALRKRGERGESEQGPL